MTSQLFTQCWEQLVTLGKQLAMGSLSPPLSPSPTLSCLVCFMFGYNSASFSANCTCSDVVCLQQWCGAVEERLHTMETQPLAPVVSQLPIAGASQASEAPTLLISPFSIQCGWLTYHNKKLSPKQKTMVQHQPVHVSNRFSQFNDTPNEKSTLVIGSSIFEKPEVGDNSDH